MTRTIVAALLSLMVAGCGDDADPGGLEDGGPSATDAGAVDAGSVDMEQLAATEPVIPETDSPCPTFETGSQTILELDTAIVAGSPTGIPGPMLFNWHGTGGSGANALRAIPSAVRSDIEAQGGLIISPSDNGETRRGPSANGVWYEVSDLEYADHLVACAVANHDVDPKRIYVTGCSAGGLMAGAMAMRRSYYVAAAYPDSGGLLGTGVRSPVDPSRVPALLTMHGGEGDVVVVSFQDTSERMQGVVVGAGGFGVDCNHGLGHCRAPGDLREAAWDFMKAHPFGASTPYASGLPAEYPDYCAIWTD